MFNSDTTSILTGIVSQVMHNRDNNRKWNEDGSITEKGMIFEVQLSVRDNVLGDYEATQKSEQNARFYVVFCGNTSVFYANQNDDETFRRFLNEIPVDEWVNTSNHDSCWRSDGLSWISTVYFEMCKACNDDLPPIKLEAEAKIGFVSVWKDVEVQTRSSRENDYQREIVSIKEIPSS